MTDLADLIWQTPWIDTHEHLVDESCRLREEGYRFVSSLGTDNFLAPDFSTLFADYSIRDLVSAGLPAADADAFLRSSAEPAAKWETIAPYVDAARATGYLRAVDLSTERLFGAPLSADTCEAIDAAARDLRRPGYYREVVRNVANVESCHVHSLDHDPFCATEDPSLLRQDLSLYPLVTGTHARAEAASRIDVSSLRDYEEVIEWCFASYAPQAVAAKCFWAYRRHVGIEAAADPPSRAFERVRRGDADEGDARTVEDYLLARCLHLAADYDLPVKLHLGYLDGNSVEGLPRVFRSVAEAADLLHDFPNVTFVLMHIGWPHQEELLAVAKHYPNAIVDLCWAWILAPLATRSFVTSFLTTAPKTKLLCFGGDYIVVENVVGHAELARRGLHGALGDLVELGWCTPGEAASFVEPLMRGNAMRVFG